jgi:hypothetical protein
MLRMAGDPLFGQTVSPALPAAYYSGADMLTQDATLA